MNFLYKIYFLIPNFTGIGILGKVINFIQRRFLKLYFDALTVNYLKSTIEKQTLGINKEIRDEVYSIFNFIFRQNSQYMDYIRDNFKTKFQARPNYFVVG